MTTAVNWCMQPNLISKQTNSNQFTVIMKLKSSASIIALYFILTRTNVYLLDIDFGSRNQGQTLGMFPQCSPASHRTLDGSVLGLVWHGGPGAAWCQSYNLTRVNNPAGDRQNWKQAGPLTTPRSLLLYFSRSGLTKSPVCYLTTLLIVWCVMSLLS